MTGVKWKWTMGFTEGVYRNRKGIRWTTYGGLLSALCKSRCNGAPCVPRGNPQASVTRILETSKISEFSTCLPSPHAYQVSSEVVLLRSL